MKDYIKHKHIATASTHYQVQIPTNLLPAFSSELNLHLLMPHISESTCLAMPWMLSSAWPEITLLSKPVADGKARTSAQAGIWTSCLFTAATAMKSHSSASGNP